jgi:hypothetical protein
MEVVKALFLIILLLVEEQHLKMQEELMMVINQQKEVLNIQELLWILVMVKVKLIQS